MTHRALIRTLQICLGLDRPPANTRKSDDIHDAQIASGDSYDVEIKFVWIASCKQTGLSY